MDEGSVHFFSFVLISIPLLAQMYFRSLRKYVEEITFNSHYHSERGKEILETWKVRHTAVSITFYLSLALVFTVNEDDKFSFLLTLTVFGISRLIPFPESIFREKLLLRLPALKLKYPEHYPTYLNIFALAKLIDDHEF